METKPNETPDQTSNETMSEAQIQAHLEKVDKESQTRSFTGIMKYVFYCSCIAVTLYHLYVSFAGPPQVHIHRSLHVGMMLSLAFMLYPIGKIASRKKVAFYDWILCAIALAIPAYIWIDFLPFIMRAGMPNIWDTLAATAMVVLAIEAARRVTGLALPILATTFIAYGLFGRNLPGIFGHRGFTWPQLADGLLGTEGLLGTAVSVSASYIFLFILFGAIMSKSGMGQFFTDLAMALAGAAKGGPAKVAIVASAFLGSVNGSAVANVCTTGPFTIPMMKKCGYSKNFAGAVESAASVGGQILPPIMGASAFIMAEILGVAYSQIIIWAAIPTLLFFVGLFIQVHLRADRTGLVGIPKEELPKVGVVMRDKGHMLLPFGFLLYMIFFSGTTLIFSAFWTIIVTIIVSWLRKSTRMGPKAILDSFADGAKQCIPVAVACTCVGIIIGVFARTGFGLNLADAIVRMGGMNMLLTLVFTMLACIVMGLGLPSIPAYIITATVAAPALMRLGVHPGAAHLFALYFAMFANITPPVALVSIAAAGISGGDPVKTGIQSMRLAIAGFIVPYIFVFYPALMLIDTTFFGAFRVTSAAIIGLALLCVALEGHLFAKVHVAFRILAVAGALSLLYPGRYTDLIGFGIMIPIFLYQLLVAKKKAALARV